MIISPGDPLLCSVNYAEGTTDLCCVPKKLKVTKQATFDPEKLRRRVWGSGSARPYIPCPETAVLSWYEGRLAEARLQGRRPLQATYASAAWWGFTSAADKQRLEATVRRAIRLGLYTADDLTPSQLAADIDDNLFVNLVNNLCHVLYTLLPNNTEHTYNLRPRRRHSLSLTVKTNSNNFINRLLSKDIY